MLRATDYDVWFLLLLNVLDGDRALFRHNHRFYNALQGGCGPFLSEGLRCITWNTRGFVGSVFSRQRHRESKLVYLKKLFDRNNVICLQEVHGKDEFLQAIQVLAPQFRLFGTFLLGNENAGGSVICIHRDLSPEEALVTHLITCHGRDHLVNIQSGQHSLVLVNVHFEPELFLRQLRGRLRRTERHSLIIVSVQFKPELTLRQLRGRLGLLHPYWPAYPTGVGVILGDFNICDLKKDDSMFWNHTFTDGDSGKTAVFHSFFHMSLRLPNLTAQEKTLLPLATYALFQ